MRKGRIMPTAGRLLVEHIGYPLLFRRTWPRLRASIAEIEAAERDDPGAVAARWERRAVESARAAAAGSPWFRARLGPPEEIRTIDDFRKLPVTRKQDLSAHAERMLRSDADLRSLQRGATGGSTGEPTPYWHDEAWWVRASAVAMRGDQWTGWSLGDRTATLWGTPLAESVRARLVRTLGERARGQLFLAGFDLTRARVDEHLGRLLSWRPVVVTGYASILSAYVDRMEERGVTLPGVRAVVSAAEPLPPELRARIERAFGAPVFDRYGCRELGMIAQESSCHAGLHVACEHVHVEIEKDGRPARPGETGRVLVTLLGEPAFPFVRYEVGDAAVAADAAPCLCGIPNPRIARVDGRLLDIVRRRDGSGLTGVFFPHLMKEFAWVRLFQVAQSADGSVDVRVVPRDGGGDGDAREALAAEIRRALGPGIDVAVRLVADLERTPSGKVRVTRSDFHPQSPRGPAARKEALR
ncbi:MAG: Phenylacetate-coenzyme A ligase [Planctomycetes bacterium]|nr:Phenylacetate-coenzyme A ligase [Planctomycetota bacterium]